MADVIIIGIGNPYRGDDAVGWAVIDALRHTVGSAIELVKERGDAAVLLDIFTRYDHVYVVDACRTTADIGAWQRIDVHHQPLPQEAPQASTHGFGVSQAISLADNLGQLPKKLILYAINGDNYNIGETLSPQVANSVASVAQAILNEEDIRTCMNTA